MVRQYDWKDSNLALFGSDVEKNIKKESAESEVAWSGCGESAGLKIWRIEKLKVTSLPGIEHGNFYNGDSYIILNTYKTDDSLDLKYDVHFWIGSFSTQDEYGTAVYKTVELDSYLGGQAIQHREVQHHESALFKGYFPRGIAFAKVIAQRSTGNGSHELSLQGGSKSGFTHVKAEEYKPRLLHFKTVEGVVQVTEIALDKSLLTSDDVFILDLGLEIYQYNGRKCSRGEKFEVKEYLGKLMKERENKPKFEMLEETETSPSHKFFTYLTENAVPAPIANADNTTKELHRLSDADGSLKFTLVKEGNILSTDFDTKDVFIFDTNENVFVWIGNECSANEKKNGLAYAHKYLMASTHPLLPVTVIQEGKEPRTFSAALG